MASAMKQQWRRLSHRLLPPVLMKHQVAWRNWRRGEPEIRLLASLVPRGRPAMDVGAHLGAYTWFLVRLASEVHVVEPQAACARFLAAAWGERVRLHQLALADYQGTAWLANTGAGEPAQAARLVSAAPGGIEVPVTTLDALALQDLGFLKIDAEGAEQAILAGGRGTIARCRPVLLVEIEQRHLQAPMDEVFAAVDELGYRGEFLLEGQLQPLERFSVRAHQGARLAGERGAPYINNFIFRPR